MFLTVIIPCYNEEENLRRDVLKQVYGYFKNKKFSWEVIISDDGSSDASRDIIKKAIKNLPGFKLQENPHGGKPSALLHGIHEAKGDYILITDMDQSTPIEEFEKLLPFCNENFAAVIGSRGIIRKNFPLYRKLGAIVFATFRRVLILPDITDTQCGFKLFNSEVLKKVFPKLDFFKRKSVSRGWTVTSFDVELLHLIEKSGGKIKEVTVKWHDKDVSKSKGGGLSRYFSESFEMVGQILRVKMNDIRGIYNS